MSKRVKRAIFWAPRFLCVLFALFLSLFALDVFGEGYSPWETVLALLMHLIPTFLVLIVLAIAWRLEWLGGILFVGLAIFYIVMFWREGEWTAFLLISGPLLITGVLFLINWRWRDELRT